MRNIRSSVDWRLLGVCWLVVFPAIWAAAAEQKAKVPDAGARQKALPLVNEIYKFDIARAKSPEERMALAKKLLQAARDTKGDLAGRFVLLEMARDISASAGQFETAFEAIDQMHDSYEVDALSMRAEVLKKVAASRPPYAVFEPILLIRRINLAIDEAVAADRYQTARQLCEPLLTTCRRINDATSIQKATARSNEIKALEAAYVSVSKAVAVLDEKPTDPAANLAVGRFRCLLKGDWVGGIPMLALGSDPTLKNLAETELRGIADADAQMALGDGWWDLSEKESGAAKKRMQERAAKWYSEAAPGLEGLAKAKAEKRIRDGTLQGKVMGEVPSEEIVLFDGKSLAGWQMSKPAPTLNWSVQQGILVNHAPGASLMTDKLFGNFQLHLEFCLPRGCNSGVFLRGRYEVQLVDAVQQLRPDRRCGAVYQQIPPARDCYLGPNRWNTLDVTLLDRTITVVLNGAVVIDSQRLRVPTRGTLDRREDQPGPILLQSNGNVMGASFRNIVLRPLGVSAQRLGE